MVDEKKPGGGLAAATRLLLAGVPSLDWTYARLTGEWLRSGEMVRCPLPGHEDSTPSFNLWAEDDDGAPQRFGCFGCGRGGDVLELIAVLEELDSDAAIDRAAELFTEEQQDGSERPARTPPSPTSDLNQVYERTKSRYDANTFIQYMVSKDLGGEGVGTYAGDEWGWTAAFERIVVPHRDLVGKITGLKYRFLNGNKASEPGSRYTSLFGAWRDRGRGRVVVCEGETDTLWAAWSLRGKDIDVVGLPSGVQQAIKDEWIEELKGREVILMFDSDDAGMTGAKNWCSSVPGALLSRLPEGEDVLSSGIPVSELLERASAPRRSAGIISVGPGEVFCRPGKDGENIQVADFAFRPIRELDTPEGPAWDGYITGERTQTLLRSTDLHSASTLTRWANRHGRAWTGGAGPSVQGVLSHLMAESAFLPLERAVTQAGKAGRSYVGPGFCIGPDKLRYIPPVLGDAKLDGKFNIVPGDWDRRAILALEALNEPSVMATVLGWLCATLLRGKRAPAPPLFVSGESGAGKTHLLQTMLNSFGFGLDVNLTTTTPFGVDCVINSSVGFPVWFDEFRGGAREDSMMRLRQMLRDAYNGQPSMKGGMTQQATELTEVSTWAGIIVSGEMSTQEVSLRDRMVMLDLNPDAKGKAAYEWLRDRRRTAGLGYDLLAFLSQRPDSLFRVGQEGPAHLPDRFRDTLGFVQAGWEAWRDFRVAQGLTDASSPPSYDDLAFGRDEASDPWLEALRVCSAVRSRDGSTAIVEELDNGSIQIIPSEVIVEAKRVGIELPARSNELVAWLTRRYTVSDVRVFGRRAKLVKGLVL